MKPVTPVLRTQKISNIITWLNRSELGCTVYRTKSDPYYDGNDRKQSPTRMFPQILGYTKDGKFIAIALVATHRTRIREEVINFLRAAYEKSPHVGVAVDFYDAYDVIKGEKRKVRTYNFLEEKPCDTKTT